ncbi:hypothetical protein Rhopal_004815-T1 [Rhodotorula paludigena]|uniref:Uncharacterized protein n=1 Tax=Rhodotorula paludigena TaxID=86838 RepID=A0AAV5GRX2_9BASI|nr:hypothetical protein Rhopal_004815-T1 [Rhodotorula paludigena]
MQPGPSAVSRAPRSSSLAAPAATAPPHSTSRVVSPSSPPEPPADTVYLAQTPPTAAPDDPPTYAQTLDATRPTTARRGRFLRYQPWIDKRAQERRDERDALRAAGLLQPSSWDIDSGDGEGTAEPHLARAASARERDELAEQRLAGASGACNDAPSTRKRGDSGASLASLGRDAVQNLSTNTFLQRVGARFSRGLPDKPLCACAIPERMVEEGDERLPPTPNADALATGLYLLDNQPISASSPLSTSATSSDARTLPIWSGLGVHHLELHVEPTRGSSTSLHGLAVGLVAGAHGQLEVRMWSLASLVNLAKWRAFDENSTALDLSPTTPGARLELPLEWARSSIRLPVPHAAGPVLFFRLFRIPPAQSSAPSAGNTRPDFARQESSESEDESDDEDDDLSPSQRRKKAEREAEERRLFLCVATQRSAFVYESRPSEKRSWTLTKEFFAPATPKFVRLVRTSTATSPSSLPSLHKAQSRPSSTAFTSTSPASASFAHTPDLHLLLGLSHRIVLIRLADSTVHELVLPTLSPASASRPRSISGSSSSAASAASHHRRAQASLSAAPARLASALGRAVERVSELVEGQRGVPAGMRGEEEGQLVKGRKMREDAADAAGRYGQGAEGEGKWVGVEEVVLQLSSKRRKRRGEGAEAERHFLLVTKGRTTYLLPSPLVLAPASSIVPGSASEGDERERDALVPLALHTFHWPASTAPPARVLGFVSPLATNAAYSHLTLCAFSTTGVAVQEFALSHAAALDAPRPNAGVVVPLSSVPHAPLVGSHLSRLSSTTAPHLHDYRDAAAADSDPDLSTSASLDFGRETGLLLASRPAAPDGRAAGGGEGGASCLFYAAARGEWVLKRLRVAGSGGAAAVAKR